MAPSLNVRDTADAEYRTPEASQIAPVISSKYPEAVIANVPPNTFEVSFNDPPVRLHTQP